MKNLWAWLYYKITAAGREEDRKTNQLVGTVRESLVVRERDEVDGPSLRFSVFPANGGIILQRYQYNPKTDRNENKLYLIHEDEDVAAKIGDIVALELMRGTQ